MDSTTVVLCCTDPDEAVTVTVDENDLKLEPPPPHPARRTKIDRDARNRGRMRRRLLVLREHPQPKQDSTKASWGTQKCELCTEATVDDVEIVIVVDAVPPDGVTVDGEKAHDAPAGSPEHANETRDENPSTGVTETVPLTLCPCCTVRVGGPVTEKSGGGPMV